MNIIGEVPVEECDIVVVGCGVAGLSSAVAAAEDGIKRIVVLEKTMETERGGNTRYTEAYIRVPNRPDSKYTVERFISDAMTLSKGKADPELVKVLANEANAALQWLESHGVEFAKVPTMFLSSSSPRLLTVGGGKRIVDALAESACNRGVSILYETSARKLLQDSKGNVAGVRALSRNRGFVDLKSKSVILACGGYEGNVEMMARYMGGYTSYIRPVAASTKYNTGEGIEMALEIGAHPIGQFESFHAEPVDPRSSKTEPSVFLFPLGILVNKHGLRFVDEGSNYVDAMYEDVTRATLKQPDGIAYCVIDSKVPKLVTDYERSVHSDMPPIEADSLSTLAAKLGIDWSSLLRTVEEFNAAVQPGEFDITKLDGKSAKGTNPPKSNWALTLDEPPFKAYPVACSVVFTYAGLKVNGKAQVMSKDGYPIPGLYAVGELMGNLFYHNYPGGTSVLRGAVFGFIAGQDAANRVLALK